MENEEINFKSIYEEIAMKYNLPKFEELAEDFDIEKITDKESDFLIREIRRTINEKISAYINLFETLINPTAPPMFVFSILRNIPAEDKEKIKEIYKTLSKTQIEIMKLDTVYSEEAEAKFVNETFLGWQDIKKEIYKLVEDFEASFEANGDSKKRSYFD
jgi:hypothetical protein